MIGPPKTEVSGSPARGIVRLSLNPDVGNRVLGIGQLSDQGGGGREAIGAAFGLAKRRGQKWKKTAIKLPPWVVVV